MRELALFAGAGGGILGGKLLGWRTVCAVERDAYARDVLVARQNDGSLDPFPVWDDVCTFDGRPWRGAVDVVSGGFPCQDVSVAGKGAGIDGARSGLWREFARIIGEVRPRFAFVENSPALVTRGLGVVLGDLAALGYDARWCVLGACDAGAPHKRDRLWIVADAVRYGRESAPGRRPVPDELGVDPRSSLGRHELKQGAGSERAMADADGSGREQLRWAESDAPKLAAAEYGSGWLAEPDVGRVAHGVAARVDRLRCLGNGQVPQQAALAWRTLTSC